MNRLPLETPWHARPTARYFGTGDAGMMLAFLDHSRGCAARDSGSIQGYRGDVFVLHMGKPVRIVDLARNLIRLSGFEPEERFPTSTQAFNEGKKLYERLLTLEQGTLATPEESFFRALGT